MKKHKKRTISSSIKIQMEGLVGFEPTNQGFADPCLTTWLCRHILYIIPYMPQICNNFIVYIIKMTPTGIEPVLPP